MKKKSEELKEKRGQLLDEVEGILKSDDSDFKRVEEIKKEIDELNTKISLTEQVEKDLKDRTSAEENVSRAAFGLPKNKDGKRTRIKWYPGIMIQSIISCAKLTGLQPAGTVTA